MKTGVLILHNIMWTHYKAIVFSQLYTLTQKENYELFVLQLATTENNRKKLGDMDLSNHKYPYKLLFNSSIEEIPWHKQIAATFKEMMTRRFDIIVIIGYSYLMCWCAMLYGRLTGKKIIVSFDSTEMDNPKHWYKEWVKKLFISNCNAAFCYGTKSKEYLIKLGMSSNNIYTRCQATDNRKIVKLHGTALANRDSLIKNNNYCTYNCIYVGRLSKEKNITTLLDAFCKVKRNNKQASKWGLIIIGDGPEKQVLQQKVTDLQIADVSFVGGLAWGSVPNYYALSDVFVLPSMSEPWGLVVNEAMVCGLPVIVSNRCGAAYDIVRDGENGFTFEPHDVEVLAQKLAFFMDNPEEIERMGKNSRNIIADYSPQHAAEQMLQGLKKVDAN
jgi:glycosyltransferase involved in cell wall biosynthesis